MINHLSITEAKTLIVSALSANSVSHSNANLVAKALVDAEIDGQKGHGFSRVSFYAAQAKAGKVNGFASPTLTQPFPACLIVDACNGFAFPAIDIAIDALCDLTPKTGIAMAGINRSHHCGQLGAHVERLAAHGFVSLMMANAPKSMAPWGGSNALFGTNPIAFAAPRKDSEPIIIDLSLSKVARGKVMTASKAGQSIPEGWALDPDGHPTTNPEAALAGTMLPSGDAKGAALALIVEILSATLIGANHSYEATSFFDAEGAPPGVGHIIIAFDTHLSMERTFATRIENLIAEILKQDGTRLPGSSKSAARETAKQNGIPVPSHLLTEMKRLATS